MNWEDQLARIRRYLRDPDGNIWLDSLLLRLYNDSQRDFQMFVGQLEDVQAIRVPSLFQESYFYEWEWRHTKNTTGYVYQALNYFDQGDYIYVAVWEPEHLAGANEDTSDDVYGYTQPWEAFMPGITPNNPPPVWADSSFDKVISIYWNKEPIEALTKKEITRDDRTWRTRRGEPFGYYRDDSLDNFFTLYPIPTDVSWSDLGVKSVLGFSYTVAWEEDYLPGTGNDLTYTSGDDETTFQWETNYLGPSEVFEYSDATTDTWQDVSADSEFGIALYDDDGDTDDFGIVVDDGYVEGLSGASTDILDLEDNLFMVFSRIPQDLVELDDESDYPEFLRKYIEYGVLEQAYAANTDGKIESLEDYWGWRKQLAYKALKLFKSKKWADRDFRFRTKDLPARVSRRRPRLPDAYPAQW